MSRTWWGRGIGEGEAGADGLVWLDAAADSCLGHLPSQAVLSRACSHLLRTWGRFPRKRERGGVLQGSPGEAGHITKLGCCPSLRAMAAGGEISGHSSTRLTCAWVLSWLSALGQTVPAAEGDHKGCLFGLFSWKFVTWVPCPLLPISHPSPGGSISTFLPFSHPSPHPMALSHSAVPQGTEKILQGAGSHSSSPPAEAIWTGGRTSRAQRQCSELVPGISEMLQLLPGGL